MLRKRKQKVDRVYRSRPAVTGVSFLHRAPIDRVFDRSGQSVTLEPRIICRGAFARVRTGIRKRSVGPFSPVSPRGVMIRLQPCNITGKYGNLARRGMCPHTHRTTATMWLAGRRSCPETPQTSRFERRCTGRRPFNPPVFDASIVSLVFG